MIKIQPTKNADSRTCDTSKVSKEELLENSEIHRNDVKRGMYLLAEKIKEAGVKHDFTKVEYIDEFYESFSKQNDNEFKKDWWYQNHISKERHHLNANAPVDVNLVDVLEHLVDCVMAGKGRSGSITPEALKFKDPELLETAYWNTVEMLDKEVIIDEE